jgi:hypothetical protein
MRLRRRARRISRGVIAKVRKPMAPPTRVETESTKYRRARERERLRRERESERN